MVETVVRLSIADVPEVRDLVEHATEVITHLQEALITERISWQPGPGMFSDEQMAAHRIQTREELLAEGLPMGEAIPVPEYRAG